MTILLFIAALAILILSHEFGHFICAKLSNTKVEEFGLGFPPRLFSVKKGETVYSVNLLPFGGFVKIYGEDSVKKLPRGFGSKPIYIRGIILVAGVFFNLVLAWFLFSLVFVIGAPSSVGDDVADAHITILEVQPGTPAEMAGLQPGDKILGFNTVAEVQEFISLRQNQEIKLEILRGKEIINVAAVPDPMLGIAMDRIGIVSLPFYKAIWEGMKNTVFLTVAIVKALVGLFANLIKGVDVAAQVMGPVGIVGIVGTASEFGFVYVIQLIALLSINLAIINMIPFPALDGGRLLFLGIEAIKRSPVNQKAMAVANGIGFAILILLMLLVTYKDIARLID
jgi:regulator of sigma E protease